MVQAPEGQVIVSPKGERVLSEAKNITCLSQQNNPNRAPLISYKVDAFPQLCSKFCAWFFSPPPRYETGSIRTQLH